MTFKTWLMSYDPTGSLLGDDMIAMAMAAYEAGYDAGFEAGVEAESSHQQDMPKEEGL